MTIAGQMPNEDELEDALVAAAADPVVEPSGFDELMQGLADQAADLRGRIDENVKTRKALGAEATRMRKELARIEKVLKASVPRTRRPKSGAE